jgi:ribonuclease Z
MKLVFLGTGSAVPTAKRNHPGFLLNYNSENILFDCGEGIQRQFRIARINPGKLTRIFITHWHGDHVLGLAGLLQTLMLNEYSGTLEIYGPKGSKNKFQKVIQMFERVGNLDVKVNEVLKSGKVVDEDDFEINAIKLNHGVECLGYNFIEKDKIRIDKKKLKAKKLDSHPDLKKLKQGKDVVINSIKLKAKEMTFVERGKKFSVILDTSYDKKIIDFVKNSDVFVCESTFFDEDDLAKEYGHLCLIDVVKIAKSAKVKDLYLVHLSQRYEKDFKKFEKEAKNKFKNSKVAKDFDKVKV